ncbi:MAG: LysR family transcriptional regulator [Clostridia bacterium]|nr:LysR family transcriptional regulator [Clostridia bacterium]
MDDLDYQLLLDLFETRNITKTARLHFISQPALTKRIQRIEQELKCELLLRSKKGVFFTAAGEALIPHCRSIVGARRSIEGVASLSRNEISGSLHVLASLNYSQFRLPYVLKQYIEKYPQVDVSVHAGKSRNIFEQLRSLEDRVVILRGEYNWPDGKLLLSKEPMCLIYSYENEDRPLQEYTYIGHLTDRAVVDQMERWATENGLPNLPEKIIVDDINSCKAMAECGIGWCVLPKICLDGFKGIVKPLYFSDGTPFLRSTYALYHAAYGELPQVNAFLKVLTAYERGRS